MKCLQLIFRTSCFETYQPVANTWPGQLSLSWGRGPMRTRGLFRNICVTKYFLFVVITGDRAQLSVSWGRGSLSSGISRVGWSPAWRDNYPCSLAISVPALNNVCKLDSRFYYTLPQKWVCWARQIATADCEQIQNAPCEQIQNAPLGA